MTIQLHCFGESGNSYKAALALELSGLDWEPVFVDFFGGATRTPDYRESVNEMGEAPVLVDGDLRLTQSGAIQQYLTDRTGKFGGAPEDRYEVLRWVLWDNHKLLEHGGHDALPDEFPARGQAPRRGHRLPAGPAEGAYQVLDAHLDGRDWIVGDGLTNADLSCCGYLYYPEPFGFDRADWPNIDAWLTRLSEALQPAGNTPTT
jgi:glutathione S-transferase